MSRFAMCEYLRLCLDLNVCRCFSEAICLFNWDGNVIMLMKLPSLSAPEVVKIIFRHWLHRKLSSSQPPSILFLNIKISQSDSEGRGLSNSSIPNLAQSRYQNKCWLIVNWTLKNKFQWNSYQNPTISIQENELENLFRPQCVNGHVCT